MRDRIMSIRFSEKEKERLGRPQKRWAAPKLMLCDGLSAGNWLSLLQRPDS